MPYAHRLDQDLKIFYLVTYGHCTFGDIFTPFSSLDLKLPNRPRLKFIIDNLLGDLEIDEAGMRLFIKSMQELKATGFQLEPTAFLTTRKGIEIFVKSLDLLADEDVPTHMAFSSLSEALIWLEVVEKAQPIQQIQAELLETLRSQPGAQPLFG